MTPRRWSDFAAGVGVGFLLAAAIVSALHGAALVPIACAAGGLVVFRVGLGQ